MRATPLGMIVGAIFALSNVSRGDPLWAGQSAGMPFPSLSQPEKTLPKKEDQSALRLTLHRGYDPKKSYQARIAVPAELLLIDPQGRRVGYDPSTGITYTGRWDAAVAPPHPIRTEIPEAYYEAISLDDAVTGEPGPVTLELDVPRPLAGDYQIQVIGTETGTYTLELRAYDPELNPSIKGFKDIAIDPGAVHTYRFRFVKVVGYQIKVEGPEIMKPK